MLYENQTDRSNQDFAAKRLAHHLSALPVGRVDVVMTPRSRADSHDLDIYLSGMYVGVGEVKARNYPFSFFEREGWFFDFKRLSALREKFYLSGHGWTKDVSLILLTNDDHVLLIGMDKIVERWDELDKSAKIGRTNHGKLPVTDEKKKNGIIIPIEWMTLIYRGKTK